MQLLSKSICVDLERPLNHSKWQNKFHWSIWRTRIRIWSRLLTKLLKKSNSKWRPEKRHTYTDSKAAPKIRPGVLSHQLQGRLTIATNRKSHKVLNHLKRGLWEYRPEQDHIWRSEFYRVALKNEQDLGSQYGTNNLNHYWRADFQPGSTCFQIVKPAIQWNLCPRTDSKDHLGAVHSAR